MAPGRKQGVELDPGEVPRRWTPLCDRTRRQRIAGVELPQAVTLNQYHAAQTIAYQKVVRLAGILGVKANALVNGYQRSTRVHPALL